MPLNRCEIDGQPGWKWGDAGTCYSYTAGDDASEAAARKKALAQAAAMGEFPSTGRADSDLLVTRAVLLDDIHIRSGGTGRDVVAYAAVWNRPAEVADADGHYMEQNHPDSMTKSTTERFDRIFSVYNHGKTLHGTPSERHSVPLGRPLEIVPDKKGLLTVTRYSKDPEAERILEAINSGSLRGMSFTGVYIRSDPELGMYERYGPGRSGDLPLVTRLETAVIEYGPTPMNTYEDAQIIAIRSQAAMGGAEPEERETITVQTDTAENVQDTTSSSDRDPAPETERTAPHPQPVTTQSRSTIVETDRETMTVEERVARQSEIRARHAELDTQYSGAELTQEARTEWDTLRDEYDRHERAIADTADRAAYLRQVSEERPEQTEQVDNGRAGYAIPAGARSYAGSGPALHVRDNIYDLTAIRNRARGIDELPVLYRDYAMRAVEQARFPSAVGRRGAPSREDAQTRVASLLDTIDDEQGTLARRVLVTGSPTYDRAFGKMLARMSTSGLTAEESRSLSLGTDAAGGYAVPFQLDPTVILSSSGVVNPLRAIARVETITGKEWDGVTSAGVSVARGTEAQEVGTGDPAFVQPTVRTTRVQGWVPFSIELDVTWAALRTQLTNILQDAKDIEEATAFATGNGTAPNPNGVVSTLGTASWVDTAGSAVLAAADIYLLENAMAPRFIANSSVVAAKTTYNRFRTLFQAQASSAGDPFSRPSQGMGPEFNGYPKYELSTMATTIGTGSLIMLQGDFNQFLIVDRVGMGIELVPQVLGSNRRPTGERGIYALWFNNSKILVDNAFRLLRIKAT